MPRPFFKSSAHSPVNYTDYDSVLLLREGGKENKRGKKRGREEKGGREKGKKEKGKGREGGREEKGGRGREGGERGKEGKKEGKGGREEKGEKGRGRDIKLLQTYHHSLSHQGNRKCLVPAFYSLNSSRCIVHQI